MNCIPAVFSLAIYRRSRFFLGLGLCICLSFQTYRLAAGTFQVTSTNDTFVVGTFRWAITNSLANPGSTITFSLPTNGLSFAPATAYPTFTVPVTIDGTSQSNWVTSKLPVIELNGSLLSSSANGLTLNGGNSTIKGLVINRFPSDGIHIEGGNSNVIQGNFIGTDVTGKIAHGNATGAGIQMLGSSGNLIGGAATTNRNVISGGNEQGIYVTGVLVNGILAGSGASNNVIAGNYIGTTVTGAAILGNLNNGILLDTGSISNLIGGTITGATNVISGNSQSGVFLNPSASGNLIEGNLIGTDLTGKVALNNLLDGVTIIGGPGNTIGGATAGARNVISGNGAHGVFLSSSSATNNVVAGNLIGTDITGKVALPNQTNGVALSTAGANTIGGTTAAAANVISGNKMSGLLIQSSSSSNIVQGNFIGTDITGSNVLANAAYGVDVDGAAGNQVGGTAAGAGNVISGNPLGGIQIINAGASNNTVAGNFIGVDITGARALSNGVNGIYLLTAASANLIGGTAAGAGNVISGNSQNGIYIPAGGKGNIIQGNFIGTDLTGKLRVGNAQDGLRIEAPGNTIGGTLAGARNIIAGNTNSGIFLNGGSASNNVVAGNYIGTDVTGAASLGNGFPNGSYPGVDIASAAGNTVGPFNVISANLDMGVSINSATNNFIQGNYIGTDLTGNNALANANGGIYLFTSASNTLGGTTAGAGNVISGNNADGIADSGGIGNIVQANYIGTKADGVSALGNLWHGVELLSNTSDDTIGGGTAAADNHIAFARTTLYAGIRVRSGSPGIFISRNSIFSNDASGQGLGIDVDANGVTTSHLGVNLPVLTSAVTGAQTTIQGTAANFANTTFLLQFYSDIVANKSGYGEGLTYLGSQSITTGPSGNASFSVTFPTAVPAGQVISATITDTNNNTSEFAQDITVTQVTLPTISCPANVTVPANSGCGATNVALGTPTYGGACAPLTVSNNAPASFPVGVTPVTWTVTDGCGNTNSCLQHVTVQDTQPPVIICPPDVTVFANTNSNNTLFAANVALGTASVTDNCAVVSVTTNAPALFPLGTTLVTWTVADGSGNTNTCQQRVTVQIPRLSIALVGGNHFLLAWPANPTNLSVVQASSLVPPAWTPLTNVPVMAGGMNQVTLTPSNGVQFYQLQLH